jgi:hypothetical protein
MPNIPVNKAASLKLKTWGQVLLDLAQPDKAGLLVEALNSGDHARYEKLIDLDVRRQLGLCIEVVTTITRILDSGAGHFEERCEVRPPRLPVWPGTGRFYRLPDGKLTWLSEEDWHAWREKAEQDETWRREMHDTLVAVGILACTQVWVSDARLVRLDLRRPLCFNAG